MSGQGILLPRAVLGKRRHLLDAAANSCDIAQRLLAELQTSTCSLSSSLQGANSTECDSSDTPRNAVVPTISEQSAEKADSNGSARAPAAEGRRRRSNLLSAISTPLLEPPHEGDAQCTDLEISDAEFEDASQQIRERRASEKRASMGERRSSGTRRASMGERRSSGTRSSVGSQKQLPMSWDAVPESRKSDYMFRPSVDMPSSLLHGFERTGADRTRSADLFMSPRKSSPPLGSHHQSFRKVISRKKTNRLRHHRMTDFSDPGLLEHQINSEESKSDSEIDDEDGDVWHEKNQLRRGGVSTPAYGQYLRRLAGRKVPEFEKSDEISDIIKETLMDFIWSGDQDEGLLDKLAASMELSTFEAGEAIVEQGRYGRSGYVLCSGQAVAFVDGKNVRNMGVGRFFGEFTMLFGMKRGATVRASEEGPVIVAKLTRENFLELMQRTSMDSRSIKETYLRNLRMFDTLGCEEIAKVADAMELRYYCMGESIIRQDEYGDEMFLVLSGECQAECRIGNAGDNADVQKHRHYKAGDRFGEKAFIEKARRAATVTCLTDCKVLCLRRSAFRRMMGNLDDIQQEHYMHDPRKTIADFYRSGDHRGPRGVVDKLEPAQGKSTWFAVYRPTSRDAISKMLSGTAVGKGLNVKGKSSKKNHLSGFVPFLQISEDRHKAEIEDSPPDSRVTIFYQTDEARQVTMRHFTTIYSDSDLELEPPRACRKDDSYQNLFGLVVHERLLREVYIMNPPLAHTVGWETGRPSVPAFMDMNLHAVREQTLPKVVLYQFDSVNPLNPHGLLIAYAEARVKPVVSDFDTFTVGSKGMSYATLAPDQQKFALQTLKHTEEILTGITSSWSGAWIELLKKLPHDCMPAIPKYGFGDRTSIDLIEAVILATVESGAVRHGAECFNYSFPQELDDEFLIVCEEFDEKPWRSTDLEGLKRFLLTRAKEGFSFPLNPVWPVRDDGWFEIYETLRDHKDTRDSFDAWFPPESGISRRIEDLHDLFPEGFIPVSENSKSKSAANKENEFGGLERADFEHQRMSRNWRRLRSAVSILGKFGKLQHRHVSPPNGG